MTTRPGCRSEGTPGGAQTKHAIAAAREAAIAEGVRTPGGPLHRYYKWELLLLLCLAFFFHQGDRAIYGVVISGIRSDLGLTDAQLGLVGSILFLTLALMMPFAGFLGDRVKKNVVITCCLIFWSAATLFTGCVGGILGLILLRSVATAGGEAFYAPAAYPLMAKFHRRTRALALSMHQAALYLGVMTSGFLGGWIAERWGWRSAFFAFGGCGIALGLVFIFRLKDPPDPLPDDAAEKSGVRGLMEAMGIIFRIPTALMLTVGLTAIVFVNNAFIVWAPEFLREKQADLSLALAGGYSMFWHHLPALVGISIGGPLSDWLVVRRPTMRLELQAFAMALGAPSIILMALAPDLTVACIGLALFGWFRGLYESNTHAALFDVIGRRHRASAVAIMVMMAFLVGSTSPWLMGQCRQWFGERHGLSYGFAGLSLAYCVGAAAVAMARVAFFRRDRLVE
ncbi:MAG TPA: MFS transporter [Verrucomicrobiae bacterium]|nr:MFS transporter [Verrucomicrobiae bacterium]